MKLIQNLMYVLCTILLLSCEQGSDRNSQNNSFLKGEKTIQLPEMDFKMDKPLLKALEGRKSQRDYDANKEINLQQISNLLWSAHGINREDKEDENKTTPLLWEMGIYMASKYGIYKHDNLNNRLHLLSNKDIRGKIANQDFVKDAPIILILTLNTEDMTEDWVETLGGEMFYVGNQVGHVSQNIYLSASAMDLSTVAMTWINSEILSKSINLQAGEKAYLIHPVAHGN